MKLRIALLAGLLAISAFAADVTGKWAAEMPGRGGQTRTVTMNFKADGTTLTGSISNPQGDTPISDGKIDGDKISFTVSREMQGNTVKIMYTGTVSGDEIKFKSEWQGGNRPAQEFTAKRSTT